MWCPPRRPPWRTSSPLQCGVSLEGGTTCGVPASSPLAHIIPPTVWCLLGGWDNLWCPRVVPPHTRCPPWSVVSPWRVGQPVVSPRHPPLLASSPLVISRDMLSPRCFKRDFRPKKLPI